MSKCPNCNKDTFYSEDRIYLNQSKGEISLNLNFCNWNCLFECLSKRLKDNPLPPHAKARGIRGDFYD